MATAVPTPVLGYAVVARMTTVVTLTSRHTTPLYNLGYVPIYQMELRPEVGRRSQSVGNHYIIAELCKDFPQFCTHTYIYMYIYIYIYIYMYIYIHILIAGPET